MDFTVPFNISFSCTPVWLHLQDPRVRSRLFRGILAARSCALVGRSRVRAPVSSGPVRQGAAESPVRSARQGRRVDLFAPVTLFHDGQNASRRTSSFKATSGHPSPTTCLRPAWNRHPFGALIVVPARGVRHVPNERDPWPLGPYISIRRARTQRAPGGDRCDFILDKRSSLCFLERLDTVTFCLAGGLCAGAYPLPRIAGFRVALTW